jgi:hypothetical protein
MKKSFFSIGIILTCVFALTACQTPNVANAPGQAANQCIAPWMENPEQVEDGITGSGRANLMDPSLSKQAADARARTEVANAIQVQVSALFTNFQHQAGDNKEGQYASVVESVSKQVAHQTLQGCKIIKRKFCPDGTVFSLAVVKKDKVKDYINNEKAQFNRFLNKQGQDRLSQAIDELKFSSK